MVNNNTNPCHNKKQNGLSVIEALVSISVFAMLSLVAVTFFFRITQLQSKNIVSNDTINEAQNLLKTLTNQIKHTKQIMEGNPQLTTLDYSNQIYTTEALALRQNDDSILIFQRNDNFQLVSKIGNLSNPNPTILNGSNVRIDHLSFEITPGTTVKPPAVTVFLKVSAINNDQGKPRLSASIDLQTTVVVRAY